MEDDGCGICHDICCWPWDQASLIEAECRGCLLSPCREGFGRTCWTGAEHLRMALVRKLHLNVLVFPLSTVLRSQVVSPKIHTLNSEPLVLQNRTVFGNSVSKEVIR